MRKAEKCAAHVGERESLTANENDLISVSLKIIRAPSSGRGRRAKRGGVGFPECGSTVSRGQPPPLRGTSFQRKEGERVAHLCCQRKQPSAADAVPLPHAGKACKVSQSPVIPLISGEWIVSHMRHEILRLSPHLFWLGLFAHRAFSSTQDDDTRGRMSSHLGDTLHVLELAVLYYDTSSPLEKGRAKGAGWIHEAV